MTEENTKRLLERFPRLYQNYYKPMTQTCMCWGFECGDGWFDIIWKLSEALDPLGITAEQVKEKFGTLRYYYSETTDADPDKTNKIFALIAEAEKQSAQICEECGKPGKVGVMAGWYSCRCESCAPKGWRETNEVG